MEPLRDRLPRARLLPMCLGAFLGACIAVALAPLLRPLFHAPTAGVGVISLTKYPKGWDYAVIALLAGFSAIGALAAGLIAPESQPPAPRASRPAPASIWVTTAIVFVLMLFA